MLFKDALVCCDIQPRYMAGCKFNLEELMSYIRQFNRVLYLFNSKDIGCPDTEETVKEMLISKGGATAEDFKKIKFQPKVYFYFRDILDDPAATYEECVKLLKMMILRGVDSAHSLSYKDLAACLSSAEIVRAIIRGDRQFYYDTRLANILQNYKNCVEIGGFEFQCNIEINLYMDALGIPYEKNLKFIY